MKEKKIRLNFNLRNPNKKEETTIFAIIYNGTKQIKISIGYKIMPIEWDKTKQMPIINEIINQNNIDKIKEITEKIIEIRFCFLKYFIYICTNRINPNERDLRELISKCLIKKEIKMRNKSLKIEEKEVKATETLNKALKLYKSVNGSIKESSIITYGYNLKSFEKYCKEIKRDSIKMITEEELKEYEIYLRNIGNSEGKIRSSLRVIRILNNEVICKHPFFKGHKIREINIKLPKEIKSTDLKVELKEEEIKAIKECKGLNGRQKEIRDLFLLEIYSGQRASDLPTLFDNSKYEIIDGYMSFITKKENVKGKVEINENIKEILERYKNGFNYIDINKDGLARLISVELKEIALKSNLNRIIQYIDNKKQIQRKYLYEIISSHFGRHTFITRKVREGMPIDTLKYLTAHKDTQALEKYYIHLTDKDKIDKIKNEKEGKKLVRINRDNINNNEELIKEIKEALYCLGASLDEIVDINDYHRLNEMLYIDFHNKYQELGCNMAYIKDLYLNKDITSLKEKRKLILKVIEEVKRKK